MNANHQNLSIIESFGRWSIELSLALFFVYFILPSLASEYNYQFRLQGFLEEMQNVRAELDQPLNQASSQEWEKSARQAGYRLVAFVNKFTNGRITDSSISSTDVFVFTENKRSKKDMESYLPKIAGIRREDVVWEGKRWLGVRYRWGGTSKFYGTDCSGFIQAVFKTLGFRLPRTAAEQFERGIYIPKSQLQPGDLVYFSTYKPGPSHVGIYTGKNRFIHASSATGMVKINSLNDGFFKRRYLAARRIIG